MDGAWRRPTDSSLRSASVFDGAPEIKIKSDSLRIVDTLAALLLFCGSGLAREKLEGAAFILISCVIVNDHRGQARSHRRYGHASTIRSALRPPRCAFDFDLRRPVKPRWPEFDRDLGGKPAGMPV
ncbi:hypothetical protein TU73_11735 [Pseudomonas libanensis]|uniref:Uncharacterized protein n=1 Tax=Pseudomonas libanensis TaxID=75588 RepID=A0A0R2YBU2_9PSED|nr:hypothetical protein TU73_11735 [Pseudomonas libanensis]